MNILEKISEEIDKKKQTITNRMNREENISEWLTWWK